MKSKILLTLFAALLTAASVSAQCYTQIAYQQSATSNYVTFWPDSISGGPLSNYVFTWSYGDGSSGSGSQVAHQYSASGTYTVCLTMNDTTSGCTFTTCDSITLGGNSSTCGTTISHTNADSVYTFTTGNTGTPPYTYSWTLNGTAVSVAASPVITIAPASGFNSVCVTVTDVNGCIATDCSYITDSTTPNTCSTYAAFSNQDSVFTFTASHIGGTPVSYQWTLNNNIISTGSSATLTLDSAALAHVPTICVTITDTNGCASTDCLTLGSTPTGGSGCQAYFVIYPDSTNGSAGYYTGYNYSSGSFGPNVLWDFGDGSTSASPYPSHTYAQPGIYIVCLTVGTAGTTCYDTYCDSSFYAFKTASGEMTHLTITGPTGINDLTSDAAIHIYPNPVTNELTINTTEKIGQGKIYNLNGQLMMDKKATGNKMDVSKLSPGIYILELTSEGATSRTKFVKE